MFDFDFYVRAGKNKCISYKHWNDQLLVVEACGYIGQDELSGEVSEVIEKIKELKGIYSDYVFLGLTNAGDGEYMVYKYRIETDNEKIIRLAHEKKVAKSESKKRTKLLSKLEKRARKLGKKLIDI